MPITGTLVTTMKHKLVASLMAVAVAASTVACSDSQRSTPLSPGASASQSLGSATAAQTVATKVRVSAVLWKSPLTQPVSASALIGPQGGELNLYTTGLRVVVPAGAVSAPTLFQVTAKPGRIVAYDFSPAGTRFAVPLRLEQDQSHIERPNGAPGRQPKLQLGYVLSDADIDQVGGAANVAEQNPMLPSATAVSYAFPVYHFSGYIVSWSRY